MIPDNQEYKAIRIIQGGTQEVENQIVAIAFGYFERLFAPGAPEYGCNSLIKAISKGGEGTKEEKLGEFLFDNLSQYSSFPPAIEKSLERCRKESKIPFLASLVDNAPDILNVLTYKFIL